MARKVPTVIVALVAAFALSVGSASAATSSEVQAVAAANGACGGGSSLSQMINGWKKHHVDDNVARSTGQTPVTDGSTTSIIRGGIVMVIVVNGGYVDNYTCRGGRFVNLHTRKYIPPGSRYYMPAKLAPASCKKGPAKLGYEARCGNKQVGNLLVKRPCNRKSKPKLPPPTITPPPTIAPPPPGGCVVNIGGDNNGVAGCGNVVVCTINGKQITDSVVCSAYGQCIAVQGNAWNLEQNVCTSGPPPCTQCAPSQVILITSWTALNDIPENRDSGPFYVSVYASAGGGSLTIDPGIGGIGDCASSTPLPTGYTASLSQGNNTVCVKLYAPKDASANSMIVKATATLGSASDIWTQTFNITHPVRS